MRVSRALVRAALGSLLATSTLAVLPTTTHAGTLPGTTCMLFPADSIFNTDISTLPVNTQSSTWVGNMTQNANLHPDLGTFAQWYGIPINVAPPPSTGVTPTFTFDTESDHPAEGYPIDQNTWIEGGPGAPSGSDRHALVVDKNLCKLYEIFNLQNFTNGQTPQAGSGAVWNLSSNQMRPAGWTSADAAGLPMAPLLLRPDEILAGSITHTIRFTAHCTSTYLWPASHQAGSCNASFPPMGARFRLRSNYNISGFSPNTQTVLRAFQRYGLILADNGSDWFFGGTTDDWWGTAAGGTVVSELKTIPASQFDAVDESSLQVANNSYQAVSSGGWSNLGGVLTGRPASSSPSASGEDVFVRGTDGGVWRMTWNGTGWGLWQPLGGGEIGDPGAVAQGTRSDVFVRGTDNQLWVKTASSGVFGNWQPLGGVITTGPNADAWTGATVHEDVFARGTDGQLWHKWGDNGTWYFWEPLGGVITADPGAVSWGPNRIDVFVRGSDNQLWHKWYVGGGWYGWEPLGGGLASGPAAASCANGHLDVFVIGTDGQLWRKGYNGTAWSQWQPLGGQWTSGPSAVCRPTTTSIDLFARGTDLALWHTTVTGS